MNANAKKAAGGSAAFSKQPSPLGNHDEMTNTNANILSIASEKPSSWTWRGDTFVRIEPGEYVAVCRSYRGPEWIPAYRRYGFRLFFCLLAEEVEITMFINFGAKPQPPKSVASRYFQAWTMANGEMPRRGQKITPDVFIDEGLLYTIAVADANIDPMTKKDKPPCLVYSRVKEILSVTRQ